MRKKETSACTHSTLESFRKSSTGVCSSGLREPDSCEQGLGVKELGVISGTLDSSNSNRVTTFLRPQTSKGRPGPSPEGV